MTDIWLEGGERPGPVRLLPGDDLPATLWVSRTAASDTGTSGEAGTRPSTTSECRYRRTDRRIRSRVVYEHQPYEHQPASDTHSPGVIPVELFKSH